jgi:hypothetical protein
MLLLAPDLVALFAAGPADAHGWVTAAGPPLWEGPGNLQLAPGRAGVQAADSGGRGPSHPASGSAGTLYLPAGAPAADGLGAVVRGIVYTLAQTRLTLDPAAAGLSCWVAEVTEQPGAAQGAA